jgi:hypothetical protein
LRVITALAEEPDISVFHLIETAKYNEAKGVVDEY